MDIRRQYTEASLKTAGELSVLARSSVIRELSRLTLPEIDAAVNLVARLVPAGNVPGMILNGLARLAGRRPPLKTVRRDIGALFRGVEQVLDRAVYGAFFAGPAAVIWGYQQLLRLAGKDPLDSFPEGTWQFYVEYALREDTARHANETHGFDTLLRQHQISLDPVDRLTAWVMAAVHCLHQYDQLLENEWRERVHIRLLREVAGEERYGRLYRDWEKRRPYSRTAETAPGDTYPAYRWRTFDRFMEEAAAGLTADQRRDWMERIRAAEATELPAYQRQMSILAYLEPGKYEETRVPIPLEKACVGVIVHGCYSLIPACAPGTERPADVAEVRAQVATLLSNPAPASFPPAPLARVRRSAWPELRKRLTPALVKEIEALRLAPILINAGPRPRELPLAQLRQAERGVGDHALTILDTGSSFVFDQSHIFFDGAWGAALAEILTGEALSWAAYLRTLPPARPGDIRPYTLAPAWQPSDLEHLRAAPQARAEASAESTAVRLRTILTLRRAFQRRSDLLRMTVNDLLILYRAIHALTYRPDPRLVAALEALAQDDAARPAALAALEAMDRAGQTNPAILIPVDASQISPRDRLYPTTFEVPLGELDLLPMHGRVMAALESYERAGDDRAALYDEFDRLQRTYLGTLAGFGAVLGRAKEIAARGESASVGALRLLAHVPAPLQRLLDAFPDRFEVLNDIIRGREVFSNIGAVVPGSTLTRFITAKDDNDQKTLAWGVVTDAQGTMTITLRDFRPHVEMLTAVGRPDLAEQIAQDYVDSYARGLNAFAQDLLRITLASRETRPDRAMERDDR